MQHTQGHQRDSAQYILADVRIFRSLIRLSVPAMIGLLVNTLYTMVDMLFVGQSVGPLGIAALGMSLPVYLLITGIALMMGVGGASLLSRELGAQQTEAAGKTASVSLFVTLTIITILAFIALFSFRSLAQVLGATHTTYTGIKNYLTIVLWGAPVISTAVVLNAQLRAQGEAKRAMTANIIGNGLNILLDALFILVFGWGVAGGAAATVIGQSCAALYALQFLHSSRSAVTFHRFTIRELIMKSRSITAIGSPTLIRQLGTSAVTLVANRMLVRYSGTTAVAAYALVGTLFMFFNMPISGVVQGFQPLAAYQYGAKNLHQVRRVLLLSTVLVITIGLSILLCALLMPRFFLGLFTKEGELITEAVPVLLIICATLPLLGIQSIGTACFQSIGKAAPALMLWILRQGVLLIPLIVLLGTHVGTIGIYVAFPLADTISALIVLLTIRYRLFSREHTIKDMP